MGQKFNPKPHCTGEYAPGSLSCESDSTPIQQLVSQIREGDDLAAMAFVREYEVEIRREARFRLRDARLRRLLDSIDICQSVLESFFIRVSLGAYEFTDTQSAIALLVQMTHNKVVDQVRRNRADCRDYRRTVSLGDGATQVGLAGPENRPSLAVSLEELITEFRNRLSDEEREIASRRAASQSWSEIAAHLNLTVDATRKRLERAVIRVSVEMGLDL